ncbi:3-dehydroquinate synthase [Carboxydothermus ferrireducens]|uniref:Multifunctional fusion protein n=1 Tax=Carboxydothermus ferrireducens DSM 11255 TaxID=1119529 RepID=A0ABX2R9G6_9THEO|nr:3-dehydroquinate synthase [Carboxydothermus ferrireducens]NYE56502.1 3-dehydroquinate synthase [Carboxydothermus ferrireducens DSM 11255]
MNIILVGLPGAGKTHTGRILARKLKKDFVDLDREIEKETGLTIKEIFARYGERYFRRLEVKKLQELFKLHNAVIATGGGTVERMDARRKLKNLGLVVYLKASPEVIIRRLINLENRPILTQGDPLEKLSELYRRRDKFYREVSDIAINTEAKDSSEVVDEILKSLTIDGLRFPRKLYINLAENGYPVYFGEKVALKAGEFLKEKVTGKKILIVSQENIFGLYGKTLEESLTKEGFKTDVFFLPQGEVAKSMEYILQLYDKAIEFGLRRHDTVMAFGGGVVGDATGFFAATYLRGINFVQVPTTLLSMVDSSVGGKVGINLPQGKNLVGAFYQPKVVLIDTTYLKTLPRREVLAGLAEIYKAFLIAEESLAGWLSGVNLDKLRSRDWQRIIKAAVKIKAKVVSLDEREEGLRAVLNLGHTIGHAIEGVNGFSGILHGEAVALGILWEAKLSKDLGYLREEEWEKIREFIEKNYAYLKLSLNPDSLLVFMDKDKKNREDIAFMLLKKIGEYPENVEIKREWLQKWLTLNFS